MMENMNKQMIILNNKCNFTKDEYEDYLMLLETRIRVNEILKENYEIILCPSLCYLSMPVKPYIKLCSQNVSAFEIGSNTGSISPTQLKSIPVNYVLLAHQEVRKNYHEDANLINTKIKNLLKVEITPILCIGEVENTNKKAILEIIKKDLNQIFNDLTNEEIEKVIIAYEPAWIIGGNVINYISQIEDILYEIKNIFPNNKLIYGGGIDTENIHILKNIPYIEGYLLGNVSLNIKEIDKLFITLQNK